MSEDITSAASRPSVSKASSSGASAPNGHGFRRAQTFDEAATVRRRPTLANLASNPPFESLPRRSSNFSDYSFGEANDILNPSVHDGPLSAPETSSLPSLSLAFALLPALAGALFKDGSAVVTDVMLLALAGIFLHWSVTQPWYVMFSPTQMSMKSNQIGLGIDLLRRFVLKMKSTAKMLLKMTRTWTVRRWLNPQNLHFRTCQKSS